MAKFKFFSASKEKKEVKSSSDLRGGIDSISRFGVAGWVQKISSPDQKLFALAKVGEALIDIIPCHEFREDLLNAGIGDGRYGFTYCFATPLESRQLEQLSIKVDGQVLGYTSKPAPSFRRPLFNLPVGLSDVDRMDADWREFDFSQYGEQEYILRYFAEHPGAPRYCVDLGAYDGLTGSNSRALFLRGWGGVLVEPDPRTFARLAVLYADRPDAICVRCAVSDVPGVFGMLFTSGPAKTEAHLAWQYAQVNTLTDRMADAASVELDYNFERHPVTVKTLSGLLEWVQAPVEIGFLSIDCEGVDIKIVQNIDFDRCRPWLISVECDDQSRPEFEKILAQAGYGIYGKTKANTLFQLLAAE